MIIINPFKKTAKFKVKVIYAIILIWLVIAKEKGVKLNKLQVNNNKKKLRTKGKKTKPSLPICCPTIFKTKKIKEEKTNCNKIETKLKSKK